ncbi:hypothetical protein BH23ACT10_BH23ACT10_15080 [soil metagenome]
MSSKTRPPGRRRLRSAVYLRAAGLVAVPATITVHQGVDMGRPSRLSVTIPQQGGITVAGHAVPIDD